MATRADQRKYHYIYRIIRVDGSGKYYIGMHSTDELEDGYFGSGTRLAKSIKKHGKDKHLKEILEYLPTREALKLREKEIVNEGCIADKLCMNLRLGGQGGFSSEEHRKKFIAASHAGGMISKNKKLGWHDPIKKKEIGRRSGLKTGATNARKNQWTSQTPEANAKRIKTMSEMGHQKGEKNSQFGSCWVTNNVKPIKIRKEQLEEYLLNGYSKGRKNL